MLDADYRSSATSRRPSSRGSPTVADELLPHAQEHLLPLRARLRVLSRAQVFSARGSAAIIDYARELDNLNNSACARLKPAMMRCYTARYKCPHFLL